MAHRSAGDDPPASAPRRQGGFEPFSRKMAAAGIPEIAVRSFQHYYERLVSGETGVLAETDIEPIEALPDADTFGDRYARAGAEALRRVVMIKLNGGLGTGMGLDRAKSLLAVKEGLTFLDIIARQALQSGFPLVLMNSFATHEDSLRLLESYPVPTGDLPRAFLQHKVPKIDGKTLLPAEYPSDPDVEWCPPGHGDIYAALTSSGMLQKLLDAGRRYAFVSNSDNLGAVLDERILGFFVANGLAFLMEAADRTPADRKGGHLARLSGGGRRFVLRESAQCPKDDLESFQDIERHRYFNTNNLWLDLEALDRTLSVGGFLKLPMIRNRKTVNPRDPQSAPVFQLETAMGSAISVFDRAAAVRVPRLRFAPVKNCGDLLVIRSDAMTLSDRFRIEPNPEGPGEPPIVDLDPRYFGAISDLEERFPGSPPSLVQCRRFEVRGDFRFEKGLMLKGRVSLINRTKRQVVLGEGEVEGRKVFD
jgi:UTP--glucose-1-phosphate uridylyltransferase